MDETHFLQLSGPTNIYGLTTATYQDKPHILVATRSGIYSVVPSHQPHEWTLKPLSMVPATLDGGVLPPQIISIDSFNCPGTGAPTVGITLSQKQKTPEAQAPIKSSSKAKTQSAPAPDQTVFKFHIFGARSSTHDWKTVAEDKQEINLSFTPFALFHTIVGNKMAFLLPGSDTQVHAYIQHQDDDIYSEVPLSTIFPDSLFAGVKSNVLCFHELVYGDTSVIALGCQDGVIHVLSLDRTIHETISLDGPISSLKLYQMKRLKKIRTEYDNTTAEGGAEESPKPVNRFQLHLLVGVAIGYAAVFRDITEQGFSNPFLLPKSDRYDSVLTVGVVPAQPLLGTSQELIIGTYGQRLLAYSEQAKFGEEGEPDYVYSITWQRIVSHPIYSHLVGDFCGNGLHDLILSSLYGIHFFQFVEPLKARNQLLNDISAIQAELEKLDVKNQSQPSETNDQDTKDQKTLL